MAIYSIIKRNFKVENSELIDFLSNPLGSNLPTKDCYVYFHFGAECSNNCLSNQDQFKFCPMEESVIFVKQIEKKFGICVNFINFENIVNEVMKFNEGKIIKLFDWPKNPAQMLVDEYVTNLEKWLYEKNDK